MRIMGIVIEGDKRGRSLGFPTVNIKVPPNVIIETGIYAGRVNLEGKKHGSALYVAGNDIIEAFIFDFDKDIYGEEIEIEIIKKIRDKKEFENDKKAIEQIAKDIEKIKKMFR